MAEGNFSLNFSLLENFILKENFGPKNFSTYIFFVGNLQICLLENKLPLSISSIANLWCCWFPWRGIHTFSL